MRPYIATQPVLAPDKLQALMDSFPKQRCTICGELKACLKHATYNKPVCLGCNEWIDTGKRAKQRKAR